MDFYSKEIPAFGVAGNFTGHLEQAGEASTFAHTKALGKAPKAIFPTYIPSENAARGGGTVPQFLHTFPFSDTTLFLAENDLHLQIEPECALLCDLLWTQEGFVERIVPRAFAASNDCSIRKDAVAKISTKKNWGAHSKGVSRTFLPIDDFSPRGVLQKYRIASFLLRDGQCVAYGEDSPIHTYSYIYERLLLWLTETLNTQENEGPCEDVHSYLTDGVTLPKTALISIGSTRYTAFGESTFLKADDSAIVILYPENRYTTRDIEHIAKECESESAPCDISFLKQRVVKAPTV